MAAKARVRVKRPVFSGPCFLGRSRREEHAMTVAYELLADRADHMGFSSPGEAEGEHVLRAVDERALAQRWLHLGHLGGSRALCSLAIDFSGGNAGIVSSLSTFRTLRSCISR
jgi:hypothetical protein